MLSRIEDASLNASAPQQQLWMDGWIVRTSPGKARRARCINAVATGRLAVDQKLALAAATFRTAHLPMVVRITRFTQPADLDAQLADRGWQAVDETRVMVCPLPTTWLPGTPPVTRSVSRSDTRSDTLPAALPAARPIALPAGMHWQRLDASTYAQEVGALRGSPPEQCLAHAQRLAQSPVPYEGYALRRDGDGQVLACGQFAREAELVGLYDVFTRQSERDKGLAGMLCERLLSIAASAGAMVAYLQTEADNHAARRVYERLGFVDAYSYHYRQPPTA